MTTVISSIVSDVSATFVDRTTLRKPEGGLPIQGVVGGAIASCPFREHDETPRGPFRELDETPRAPFRERVLSSTQQY